MFEVIYMDFPIFLQRYIEFQRASFRGVHSPIAERWIARVITRNLHNLGEQGAEIYLKDYGRNISEQKVVELALKAEIEGYREMALGFWKKAYEIAETSQSKDVHVATMNSRGKQHKVGTHVIIYGGDYVAGDKQTRVDQRGQTIQGGQTNSAGPAKEERMTVFDQRGQHVNYQYNAAGDINFGTVQNKVDLVGELEKLKAEIGKAGAAQVIDAEVVTDAEYQITKAMQEAKKPEPKKETVLERINGAKALIEGVAAAGGMVAALIKAAELVQKFF